MRKVVPAQLERARIRHGWHASDASFGLQGAFVMDGPCATPLKIIACDGTDPEAQGWEHVSVSCRNRPPNWQEMCFVKELFWTENETVIQFHPPRAVYVNCHPYCLHLWRPVNDAIALPPVELIGPLAGSAA